MTAAKYTIESVKGGYEDNFTYICTCNQTGAQFVVDAGLPAEVVRPHVHSPAPALLITHTHGDHTTYLQDYLALWPEAVTYHYHHPTRPLRANREQTLEDGEIFKIGELKLKALHTPGHFPDSLCFLMENILFTGDTLFVGRTGRTVDPLSNTRDLYHSVYEKLLPLPPETLIYPGHDYGSQPVITLGTNIQISPLLQAGDEEDFLRRMADFEATQSNNP
ncbi:MAG: MBL fold metallo-hydrolase [Fidelibacterota bacterium]